MEYKAKISRMYGLKDNSLNYSNTKLEECLKPQSNGNYADLKIPKIIR